MGGGLTPEFIYASGIAIFGALTWLGTAVYMLAQRVAALEAKSAQCTCGAHGGDPVE